MELIDLVRQNLFSYCTCIIQKQFLTFIDGCRSTATEILSHSGNPNLTITIQWPETNIGELAEVDCPCGNVTSMEGNLRATRYCGGNFIDGGQWRTPNIAPCNFSDLAREICALVEVWLNTLNVDIITIKFVYIA